MDNNGCYTNNNEYWNGRASSYSDINREELEGESRIRWSELLLGRIGSHFKESELHDIHVLDIGTGPGFFAIILAEAGCKVTAVDMSKEMLAEAIANAGDAAASIDFRNMNAESLDFRDASFDVIVTRNLTWNLPNPSVAYKEWSRVLRPGGLLLNFDANWYRYLFDETAMLGYESDRVKSRHLGLDDQNIGENFDVMEDIARSLPLSPLQRPSWDVNTLSALGFETNTNTDIWKQVWTYREQINFASTPMFMISAVK